MTVSEATTSSVSWATSVKILPCLSASSAYSLHIKNKTFLMVIDKNGKTYVAYSLATSAPCAKYSFPVSAAWAAFSPSTSAYSELALAASVAFSLITSVASRTFS